MRYIKYILLTALLWSALGLSSANAQFEHKVTLNFSLGLISPVGVNEYIYPVTNMHYTNNWLMPYLFSNFNNGYSFTGGAQFNINRYFALGTGVGAEVIGGWDYIDSYNMNGVRIERDFLEWTITDGEDNVLSSGTNELNLYNLSIGVFPRINLAYGRKLNPYFFVEVTFNYTDINYVDNRRQSWIDMGYSASDYDAWYSSLTSRTAYKDTPQHSFGVGLYPGFGFDLNVSNAMGVFIHGGYSYISINKTDLEQANLEPENFNTIKVEMGLKFSFLRSKDI